MTEKSKAEIYEQMKIRAVLKLAKKQGRKVKVVINGKEFIV